MTEKKYSIKTDFNLLTIAIIPICIAVNFVGGQLASLLKLPMYLDTIGTIFASIVGGPWVGAVAGGLTNVVTGIANPVNFAFIPVNVLVGLVTGFFARKKWFSSGWLKWLLAMIVMAIVSIVSSAPIVVIVYGGVTGSGTSLITAAAVAAGANIWAAFFGTEGIFTVLDRVISFFLCWAVIKVIPPRTLIKFPLGENYIKEEDIEQ